MSWFSEPGAFRNDAFSFSWNSFRPYIFPPFAVIGRCLNKLLEDEVSEPLLVVPHWEARVMSHHVIWPSGSIFSLLESAPSSN